MATKRTPAQASPSAPNACKTILTKFGLAMKVERWIPTGQLLVRLDQVCDLRLTFTHDAPATDYRFELDIDSAIARLTYRVGSVR